MKKTFLLSSFLAATFAADASLVYDYNDNQGANWSSLGDCSGTSQSPIDLPTYTSAGCNSDIVYKIDFETTPFNSDLRFPGDTSEPNNIELVGQFSKLRAKTIDNNEHSFNALQFHVHSPSEHTVNGQSYDVELHIVHKLNNADAAANDNQLAVLGLFFNENNSLSSADQSNTLFGKIGLETFTTSTGNISNANASTIFADFDPSNGLWAYKGSLTTPPCTETVNWFVSTQVLDISTDQLTFIQNLFQQDSKINSATGNNRAIQNLSGRSIEQVCANQNTASFTFANPPPEKPEPTDDSQSQLQFAFALLLILSLVI